VEFLILGPVEVRVETQRVALGGPKQRALLALLLLRANEVVSRGRLIDALWGERAPASAERSLDSYVSRLRTVLGAERIERRAPGYRLRVDAEELDFGRFEVLLERGQAAVAAGDAGEGAELLRAALALWRGRALADLEFESFLGVEAEWLEERRLLAFEALVDAELAVGAGPELIAELEVAAREHPFRERVLGQLMTCLYRAGRQADALALYQGVRRRFAAELGLEPSPELRALERRILEHDPALGRRLAGDGVRRRRRITRLRVVLVAAALAALAAITLLAVELGTGRTRPSSTHASVAGVFELRGGAAVPVAGAALTSAPAAMAADRGTVWLAEPDAGAVVRVALASRQVVDRIPITGSPSAIAVGGGAVWVASVPGDTVTRLDPATGRVTQTIRLGGARVAALAFGFGRVWVADATDAALLQLDPATGGVQRTLQIDVHPTALAVGARTLWIADYGAGSITEIDPRNGESIATVTVGKGPVALAIGRGGVWVVNRLDSTVAKVDPRTSRLAATVPVGSDPVAVAVSGAMIAVANQYSSSVSLIDPRGNKSLETLRVGGGPTALVSAAGQVWVGTRALRSHRGGTLLLLHTRPLSLDPALQVDLPPSQSNGLTNDALLTYAQAGGAQALQLIPDLAVSVPASTDHGTTYTFRLRPEIRYSNGRPVRAKDFRRALERLFRLDSPLSGNYLAIVGATRCTRIRCDLSDGVQTDEEARTITFHLRGPDPDFLSNLTSIATTPVPAGTSFHDVGSTPIPGTGPYVIAAANKQRIRYVRNRRFREWSHAAQPNGNPDEIVMRYGLSPAQEVRAVERGQADWTADGVPAALIPEVTTHFAAQTHTLLTSETDFLQLNTTLAPFTDKRARQALNLAINRRVIVRMYGGPAAATPTCQVLPPGLLGYRRYCPYTRRLGGNKRWRAPDLARALRLVAASGTRGAQVTVWVSTADGPRATAVVLYTVKVLRRLGYRARAHFVSPSFFQNASPTMFRKIQMTLPGWLDPTPYGFFGIWFLCSAQSNHHWFCDRGLDAAIQQAHTAETTDTRAASALWTKIDHELVDRAAWVPLVNPHAIDFISARVHNYEAHPALGLLADQVWLP